MDDLLSDMIKDTYKKIDSANSNFCGTSGANTKKLSNRIARTLILGKGNADDLLKELSGGSDCGHKNCGHKH